MNSILILGAGLMQKPAILAAKKLGLKTFVIDADPNAISVSDCDVFKKIDLKEKDEILEYAFELKKNQNLSAVFTAGTDFSASVSYVAEKTGLSSHSYESALNASDKILMRSCFKKQNLPSPDFIKATKNDLNEKRRKEICDFFGFPFVIKPVDNMGARGCRMVRSYDEYESSLTEAIKNSRTESAIIEEYMAGDEFSIDALVFDKKMIVTGFAKRHIFYEPYFIETGHTMPAKISEKMHDELISVFSQGVFSLGLSCGAAKADIKYTKNGPMIGEIAGRLSGGYMSGWTFPYSSDFDLTLYAEKIALGKNPTEILDFAKKVNFLLPENSKNKEQNFELYEIPSRQTSCERAWISIPGIVKEIYGIQNANSISEIRDVLPRTNVKTGTEVFFPKNNVQKCGNVISVSENYEKAKKSAEKAVSEIFIQLEPKNLQTDSFLKCEEKSDEKNFPPYAFGKLYEKDFLKINGTILKSQKVQNQIPDVIKNSDLFKKIDWNYNSIEETVCKFDFLRPNHPEIPAKDFWKALLRGGIQAVVYLSDSISDK